MKIAIIGYGRMGKETEKVALARNHEIVATIDNETAWKQKTDMLKKADVAIEFSIAGTAPDNILKCFDLNLPVVCGTTGWLTRLEEVRLKCEQKGQAFFYAPNFSIGVNMFFEINKRLALLMKGFSDYEVSINEAHHIHKADAPSGTAIKLAADILEKLDHKSAWSCNTEPGTEEIGITAIRRGEITGSHSVEYESPFDKIRITHSAKNRRGFATGAVLAAEWLPGKKGFFGMQHLLNIAH